MKDLFQQLTLMGRVSSMEPDAARFTLKFLNDGKILVRVAPTTYYEVLRNVGEGSRDRVKSPKQRPLEQLDSADRLASAKQDLVKYLRKDCLIVVAGILGENGDKTTFDARRIVLMHYEPDRYGWEDAHWWLQQTYTLFGQWLDVLFNDRHEITQNDVAELYRTYLDLLGGRTDNVMQECATLSRFLFGLSTSYLLTGNERVLSAARACAQYLTEAFSVISHDRQYCFWKFGRVFSGKSTREMVASQNTDDLNSYALYEQIYALSGLVQYFRVTQDTGILQYIKMTLASFQCFYRDRAHDGDPCFSGKGGYFSHIDTVTMRPDSPALEFDAEGNHYDNRRKRNWNSIGDHIPAYLINLLLAIDPLPEADNSEDWDQLRSCCREILDECVDNIHNYFVTDKTSPFVFERFDADWNPDLNWGWQKDRGIVGHNLKIAWNLVRCGHYYRYLASVFGEAGANDKKEKYRQRASRCYETATRLGKQMATVGVDLMRGGIWDAIERHPNANGTFEFAWGSNKDFWQQEQAILAYYILQGIEGQHEDTKARFLELGRACAAFWNLFFIDQDNRKVFFRTDESGCPIIRGQYGIQAGHAIAGYHTFELNYLAHVYIRTYVSKHSTGHDNFALTFRPVCDGGIRSINVLPDFMCPDELEVVEIRVNGLNVHPVDPRCFKVDLSRYGRDPVVEVEFLPVRRQRSRQGTLSEVQNREN